MKRVKTKFLGEVEAAKSRYKNHQLQLLVTCPECLKTRWRWYPNVYTGKTLSCKKCFTASQRLPLGKKWRGKLTPIKFVRPGYGGHRAVYLFKCDCGGTIESEAHNCIRSCGCLRLKPRPHLRQPNQKVGIKHFWHTYRSAAKKRKLDFKLTPSNFERLVTSPCFYCGTDPSARNFKLSRSVQCALSGIDRISSSGHYDLENTVPCCPQCNTAKNTMGQTAFLTWVNRVARLHPTNVTILNEETRSLDPTD